VVNLIDDAWTGAGWNVPALGVLAVVLVIGAGVSFRVFRWE
jgi:hypothetical protein